MCVGRWQMSLLGLVALGLDSTGGVLELWRGTGDDDYAMTRID